VAWPLPRHLVEEAGDSAQPAIVDGPDIGALDDRVGAFRPERPGEADAIGEPVRLALQREAETVEALVEYVTGI